MEQKLRFIRLANKWFLHDPTYKGKIEDLEVTREMNTLCNTIDNFNKGIIEVFVSTEKPISNKFYTKECILTSQEFLENMPKRIFGGFPKTIYIRL